MRVSTDPVIGMLFDIGSSKLVARNVRRARLAPSAATFCDKCLAVMMKVLAVSARGPRTYFAAGTTTNATAPPRCSLLRTYSTAW